MRDIARYDPLTDTTTVVNHLIYDAFGNVTSESEPPTNRAHLMGSRRRKPAVDFLLLFTRRPFDADTGLQNNLNRWYDPRVGRWLSEDPLGFTAGDENLYRYVGNGVLTAVDPAGKACLITYDCTLKEQWESPHGRVFCQYDCHDVARRTSGWGGCDCGDPRVYSKPLGSITGTHWRQAPPSLWPWSKPKCEAHVRIGEPFVFCPERELVFPIVEFQECVKASERFERASEICGLIKDPRVETLCKAAVAAGAAVWESYCVDFQKPLGTP